MMLELSEIWNFHRHCGKVLLVCFNTGNISISWPVRMAAVGEAVDLCLQSLGRSTDKGTLTAVNFVWTLSIQLTHHRLFSLITGGKSTMKCPKQGNTRDLLDKTTALLRHKAVSRLPQDRNITEGTFHSQPGQEFQSGSWRFNCQIHPELILAEDWLLCFCVYTYNNTYIKYQWSLFNGNFTILVKLWCLKLFF